MITIKVMTFACLFAFLAITIGWPILVWLWCVARPAVVTIFVGGWQLLGPFVLSAFADDYNDGSWPPLDSAIDDTVPPEYAAELEEAA